MVELWFREVGFFNNPFSIKPLAFHSEVYGYDIQEILTKIKGGEVLFIEGDYGKGKTTVLKKIIREFGGKKELIYYSCNRSESNINLDELLTGKGFFTKLFKIKSNNNILLLDEAQDLTEEDSKGLCDYYRKHFKSIVLVSLDYKKVKFSNGLRELIKDNIIKLKELSDDDSVRLIRKRIGNSQILSDEIIKKIFSKSDKNPRKFLRNCEEVCRYAVEEGDEIVNEAHIAKVLG